MRFGENLYNLRKASKMSQENLAEKVEVSRQSISKWELGEAYPEMNNIIKLCKLFQCQINDLINDNLVDIESFDRETKKFQKNYERFLGFAQIYDQGRPELPDIAIEILKKYIENEKIDTIVDIGCGTGLSTNVCENYENKVIGVEPSVDMLNIARLKENNKVKFVQGWGDKTGLESEFADIVICSQAFHWMEPKSTINEVYRILKKGGIFAVIDADYPPVIGKELEKLVWEWHEKTAKLENRKSNWISGKSEHLNNIRATNLFEYTREICFSSIEKYDKERYKKFMLSQSSMQQAIKNNYDLIMEELNLLDEQLDRLFRDNVLDAIYSYKMRIGIK